MVGVMNYEHFYGLFERCMEEIDHVPPELRPYMMEIAESFLHLATGCALEDHPQQNAPTTTQVQ